MTYYLLSVISFTGIFLFYLVRIKKWNRLSYYALFVIILTGIFYYSLKSMPYTGRGPEDEWIFKDAVLFLAMLAGMITNTLSNRIQNRKLNVKKTDFLKPLFVAPIVFMVVWGVIGKMIEFNFMTCCFAYTNGYFWESLLKKGFKQITEGE